MCHYGISPALSGTTNILRAFLVLFFNFSTFCSKVISFRASWRMYYLTSICLSCQAVTPCVGEFLVPTDSLFLSNVVTPSTSSSLSPIQFSHSSEAGFSAFCCLTSLCWVSPHDWLCWPLHSSGDLCSHKQSSERRESNKCM